MKRRAAYREDLVDGFVVLFDDEGKPFIRATSVQRTGTDGLYYLDGAVYTLAETFFPHEYPAYLRLLQLLRNEEIIYKKRLLRIGRDIDNVTKIITALSNDPKE